MAEKDWYDELTKKHEFTVVQPPHQGHPPIVAAKGFLARDARRAAGAAWQGGRATVMSKAHREAAAVEEMQGRDEGQGAEMQGTRLFLHRTLV